MEKKFVSRVSETLPDRRGRYAEESPGTAARLAVVCDFPEEGWASMDLAAEMLLRELPAGRAVRVCPPFRRRAGRLPWLGRRRAAFNLDRLLNRLWDYPRYLRGRREEFALFHLCDHSYAQLVHVLPAERTGVMCHDLDTFRCLLEPLQEPRPAWFRAMARHVLAGLRKAAAVFYTTEAVRRGIEAFGLVEPARLVHAPNGVSAEFTPEGEAEDVTAFVASATGGLPYVLHVGSCIPRKRVDVLLDVFSAVRRQAPGLLLVQVGGEWTAPQREQLGRLGLGASIIQLRGLPRRQLAGLYRQASAVLQPSEAEGFGLPVVEALACGAVVLASDIPVLREVGAPGAVFCPVADVAAWGEQLSRVLTDPGAAPPRSARLAQGRRYTWEAHARTVAEAYARLLGGAGLAPGPRHPSFMRPGRECR
jgi:glycosyltransferase involved in cell wall biosynthesis